MLNMHTLATYIHNMAPEDREELTLNLEEMEEVPQVYTMDYALQFEDMTNTIVNTTRDQPVIEDVSVLGMLKALPMKEVYPQLHKVDGQFAAHIDNKIFFALSPRQGKNSFDINMVFNDEVQTVTGWLKTAMILAVVNQSEQEMRYLGTSRMDTYPPGHKGIEPVVISYENYNIGQYNIGISDLGYSFITLFKQKTEDFINDVNPRTHVSTKDRIFQHISRLFENNKESSYQTKDLVDGMGNEVEFAIQVIMDYQESLNDEQRGELLSIAESK